MNADHQMDDLMLLKPGGIVPVDIETTGKLVNMIQRLQDSNRILFDQLTRVTQTGCVDIGDFMALQQDCFDAVIEASYALD